MNEGLLVTECTDSSGLSQGAGSSGSCQSKARKARLSLPLSVRAGQWRWGRGRGRGSCRGLRGRGLRERRHRNRSADSDTASPGRQPLETPLDGRMPLQVREGSNGDRQPDSTGHSEPSHTPFHTRTPGNDIFTFTQAVVTCKKLHVCVLRVHALLTGNTVQA